MFFVIYTILQWMQMMCKFISNWLKRKHKISIWSILKWYCRLWLWGQGTWMKNVKSVFMLQCNSNTHFLWGSSFVYVRLAVSTLLNSCTDEVFVKTTEKQQQQRQQPFSRISTLCAVVSIGSHACYAKNQIIFLSNSEPEAINLNSLMFCPLSTFSYFHRIWNLNLRNFVFCTFVSIASSLCNHVLTTQWQNDNSICIRCQWNV